MTELGARIAALQLDQVRHFITGEFGDGAAGRPFRLSAWRTTSAMGSSPISGPPAPRGAHRLATAVEAGMARVNSQNVRQLWVPLAGMEESGMGREGGHDSFDFYTLLKTVHVPLGPHPIPRMGASW